MAKVKRILFNTNYYELGEVKYAKGQHYPVTDETQTRVKAGDAEPIDADMDPAEAAADKTEATAQRERELAPTRAAETGAQDRQPAPQDR